MERVKVKTVKDKPKINKIVDCLPVPIRHRVKDCINRGVKGCILEHRKSALIVAGAIGLLLAFGVYNTVADWFNDTPTLKSSITILALSLPTLFILWMFRTHDTQENINNTTLFECARLLATKDSLSQKIALEQLAYLRRETSFDKKRIDLLTRNLSLQDKDFSHAQLRGLDLSGADLRKTTLIKADLREVTFDKSDLRGIVLSGADLSNTNLKGSYYNDETNFKVTVYDKSKEARDKAGLIEVPLKDTESPLCLFTDDRAERQREGIENEFRR